MIMDSVRKNAGLRTLLQTVSTEAAKAYFSKPRHLLVTCAHQISTSVATSHVIHQLLGYGGGRSFLGAFHPQPPWSTYANTTS
nr:hypothetical protein BgiMline_022616 [Biomphalaria glabrata]